jgi:DMSO/TMAO reductase YedYZ molybdopterin-dependent catalytic subunit
MAAAFDRIAALVHKIPWYRLAGGGLAGGGALAVTAILRWIGLGIFLPEIAVEFAVGRIPGATESFFIRTLGEGAKLLALLTAVVVFLLLPAIYAATFRPVQRWLKNRWLVMTFFTFSSAGIVLLAILPLLDAGFLGSRTFAGAGFASFSQLLGSWVFAALLDYFFVDLSARYPDGFSPSRRQFLVASVGAIVIAALAIYGLASLSMKKGRLVFASIAEMIAKERTPTSEFYVVTKNVVDPTVDEASWTLSVGGMVARPSTHRYADLVALADPAAANSVDAPVTLECVSNEVGGNLISNAQWNGVRLSALLQAAGLDPTADWIVFTCADGYTAAIPLARAMNPNTIVAVRMNGSRLATSHGFPARIIVPGLYGMFHAKWLTTIEARHGEYLGYWQQKGWTNRGPIRTTAIVATPADGTVVNGPVQIGGIAFAGDRGISAVEVSTDGGIAWRSASLRPPPSNLTWVLWTFNWSPPGSGSYRILIRAIDGAGNPQEIGSAPPFPDGSAGYDSITLLVA